MSLIRSLNSGVSGLRAFQTKMDVIGNNIANVETAGFKSSRVSFAEMMNQRLGRSGGGSESSPQNSNQVGLGVRVSSIDRNFSQGAITTTGVGTDLAIEGEGFFVVNSGNQSLMTRAGNFVFNKDGFLVDQSGNFVQGYNADPSGNILAGGRTNDVRIDFENALPPKQTELVKLAGNLNADTSSNQIVQALTGFTTGGALADENTLINDLDQTTTNLDGTSGIDLTFTDNGGTQQTITYNFTAADTLEDMITDLNTGLAGEGTLSLVDGVLVLRSDTLGESELSIDNFQVTGAGDINLPSFQVTQEGGTNVQTMSTSVYDNLGRAHSVIIEFTQIGDNEWSYEAKFPDGQEITDGGTGTVNFDELGNIDSILDENGDPVEGDGFGITFEPGNGANATTFEITLGDSGQGTKFTQYAGANSAKVVSQDGYQQGTLVDMNIDADGRVQGIFDNGKSQVLSQLALAQVQNQNGLELVEGGLFLATSAAGEVFVDTAQNISGTSVNSGSLEGSNVDLAKQFTDMITSQRAYQSSARVISTSDEMLTEAVNLKR